MATALLAPPPPTCQHSLTPATVPASPAAQCSEYTHAHKTEEEENEKEMKAPKKLRKQRTAGKVRQVIEGGVAQLGAPRSQGCANRARLESEISVSSYSLEYS